MRVIVNVATSATELPWNKVTAPGRGLAYRLLEQSAPALATALHNGGWGPHRMVPMGYGAPLFPHAARRPGKYAVGGPGIIEFGSPLEHLVDALADQFSRHETISWGGMELHVLRVGVLDPPSFSTGRARMETRTPVVLKGRASDEAQDAAATWIMPNEPHFPSCFGRKLVRKAETLGLTPHIQLDKVITVGPKRSFSVGKGAKPGANVNMELSGNPEVLRALWSWGLGEANSAGFGWVNTTELPG